MPHRSARWRSLGVGLVAAWTVLSGCRYEPPLHLVLITVDTLRADHLGCYGDSRGLTPEIDRLAERCMRFETAYAAAPYTLPSVAAMLTGRHPEDIGVTTNLARLRPRVTTLAERLRQAGWQNDAVVSNFVLREESGLPQGFDRYDAEFSHEEAVRKAPERVADRTTDAALAMLADLVGEPGQRIFLWVHYQDPHGPYTPPEPLRARYLARERSQPGADLELALSPTWSGRGKLPRYQFIPPHRDVGFYRAGYAAEIRFMDQEVGRLLEELERVGVMDRALVIFSADHGEGLGEDDYWFAHGERLTEPSVRIPLLVCDPSGRSGVRRDRANLVDIAPTALSMLGLDALSEAAGRDLSAPGAEGREAPAFIATWTPTSSLRREAMVRGDYKLIRITDPGGDGFVLHRLPDEEQDLAAVAPEMLDELARALEAHRASVSSTSPAAQELGPNERDALEALGYGE